MDHNKVIIQDCPKGGRCTGENDGPWNVVFTVQYKGKDGKWVRRGDEILVKAKDAKDFEVKPGDRVRVRTVSRDVEKACSSGRVTVPWD